MNKRLALITGAIRGIGNEVALLLARDHGFRVLMGARDDARGQRAAQEIGHDADAVQLDVSNDAAVRSVRCARQQYGCRS